MGCGSSKTTVVQPMRSDELEKDENETGSKHGSRGDSAISKGTTDSGVMMENGEVMLPGTVPRKLPPLTAASPGLLQQENPALRRAGSTEILEQLLSQGIIPAGQPMESSSGAGEAYNVMLEGSKVPTRRPPARLESLKARKEQSPTSRETIDEKMRLAEERRKLREDELKTRLRTKTAHVRVPASASTSAVLEEPDTVTPVEQLQNPLTFDPPGTQEDPLDPLLHTQVREAGRGVAEGGEWVRQAGGNGGEGGRGMNETRKDHGREKGGGSGQERREVGEDEGESRGEGREGGKSVRGDGGGVQGEEVTRVEELRGGQLLTASLEMESDSTFQQTEHNEEIF